MRRIEQSFQFKRDMKREAKGQHRVYLAREFAKIINALASDETVPASLRDHALTGNLRGLRDCHIRPDLVLICAKPD